MVIEDRPVERSVTAQAPARPRRHALVAERDAVRLILWGDVGADEVRALDERLSELRHGRALLVVDLTGVTLLHADAIAWLGARHAEFGPERPMIVVVIADGHVHYRLTQPGAPQLRLTLE